MAVSTPRVELTEPALHARLKPVLDTWAGRVIHIGHTGDGHRMKLLNNFLSLGYAALYAEALAVAAKALRTLCMPAMCRCTSAAPAGVLNAITQCGRGSARQAA